MNSLNFEWEQMSEDLSSAKQNSELTFKCAFAILSELSVFPKEHFEHFAALSDPGVERMVTRYGEVLEDANLEMDRMTDSTTAVLSQLRLYSNSMHQIFNAIP